MIRSTNISTKFANMNKKNSLNSFIEEYQYVVKLFVDILWDIDKIRLLIPKDQTDQIKDKTWLSARSIQAAAKQASGIVRGTKRKNNQRLFIYDKLNEEGQSKKAKKLKAIIDKNKESRPNIESICPELDSRFIKIEESKTKEFDGWLSLSSLGNKMKIKIPFKKTKHFNVLNKRGTLKNCIRLHKNQATLMFDIPENKRKDGKTLGVDIGIKNVVSCSNGFQSVEDVHGWNLAKIQKKMSLKKKGSNGFKRCQNHRKNFTNWSINQINFDNVKTMNCENIKYMRKGVRTNRFMSHFVYSEIFGKLKRVCEDYGVQVKQISPTYSSQRCSECGWVRKSNRNGKQFKCKSCGFSCDADLNASRNIALELPAISRQHRLRQENREGFYWNALGQEPIVPDAQKPNFHIFL